MTHQGRLSNTDGPLGGSFTILTPRQPLTGVPYALHRASSGDADTLSKMVLHDRTQRLRAGALLQAVVAANKRLQASAEQVLADGSETTLLADPRWAGPLHDGHQLPA